jgi:riboflavin kinase / FMN adenylyltransferase
VTVEAYLLDFEGDLYDHRLRVEVGERLRDERRFESIDALIAQIREDVARVRRLSSRGCSTPRRWPSSASNRA